LLSREWLGKPLEIEFAQWTRDPQGRYPGGKEMSISPIEMVRFGELYRLGGRWNGQRVMGYMATLHALVEKELSGSARM